MKKSMILKLLVFLSVILVVVGIHACGGGSSSDDSDDDTGDAGGGIVGADGSELTSVDTDDPVYLSLTDLDADTQYNIVVTDADGNELNPSGGFVATTDEDGVIPASTIVQNLSTVDDSSSLIKGLVYYDAGFVPRRVAPTGSYSVSVTDADGTEVFTDTFTVADNSKAYCSDSAGVGRASFTPSESVYVTIDKGDGSLADGSYTCYVMSDQNTLLADGDAISGTSVTVTVASGVGTTSMGSFASGIYDVVCDINGNGTYNAGTDLLSRPGRFRPCFTIQDENSGNDIIGQICSDRNGNYRDVFDPDATDSDIRDVFAWISPTEQSLVQHATGVCKYVVDHKAAWTNGDTLTDVDAAVEIDPVQGFCTNEAPWLVWPRNRLAAGCYDCIIDVECDGTYDKGTDFIDNIDNTGDDTTGGMCVADSGACSGFIDVTSHDDGATTEDTAITLTATLSAAGESGKVIVSSGSSSNTINIDVSTTAVSANIPLFSGENHVTIAVTKSDGTVCTSTFSITSSSTASADELFRAQLTWDGDTDMDLHLVRPTGAYSNGGGGADDCNYSNCDVGLDGSGTNSIDWGTAADEDDDPKLDVDCIACGNGIENIWMNEINDNGVYKVYVDAYSGSETNVQVTVFIKGSTVGTVNCGSMASGAATDSCYVGDITWSGGSSGNGNFSAVGTLASDF